MLRVVLCASCAVVSLVGWAASVTAQEALWQKLIPGKRVEADPHKDYIMTDENGPWMILATTFSGDGAQDQARELVLELRSRYQIEAYIHEKSFDFTGRVRGRGIDRYGEPVRMRYRREMEIREIAVLVGNFSEPGHSAAQADLHKIKTIRPGALDKERRGTTNQTLAAWRRLRQAILPDGDARRSAGPMAKAFITRNPLLPKEYFTPQGLDPLVVDMNREVKYSLLDAPSRFSVKVATFTGRVVIDPEKVERYENGTPFESRLAEAAEKAENLTTALRMKGYEAYSFHDRMASIVTIGSFASVGTPRADGKIELDPRINAIIEQFRAKPIAGMPNASGSLKLEELIKIPFDIQPQIVQIPKESISSQIARRPE